VSDFPEEALAEAIAHRVVELLRDTPDNPRFIDAAEVARLLSVSRATVYTNANELGAVRLGSGPRARLRFDPRVVEAKLAARGHAAMAGPPARRRRPRAARRQTLPQVDLLPIAGR
jgi:hypothetical protein